MSDYFVDPAAGPGQKSQYHESEKALFPSKDSYSQRGFSQSLVQPVDFDSFKYGFELPASTQLNRVNAKMGRWDRVQELIGLSKMNDQQKTKRMLDRWEKQERRHEEKRKEMRKHHAFLEGEKHQKWLNRVHKCKLEK